ncbi:MarR family winged helix-turn-helix transcriptional regulator [Phenylobacterium montanum]|uniref:MarR family transcriptional regulator n=1 Tax=Phenylobacterium montanum TaxID=2823693 RepID=A0A975FY74_9CAUL|nr:MarR family transcriptional regulator [Caulobacter sp. S6]QUD87351.1 MarR family transcriptional regulator [Caulobacter sp. S6]
MNASAQSPSPAEVAALAEALRPALLRLSRRLRQQSQSLGLSPLDAMILGAIRKVEGIGVSELADREQMSRPTMSAHVKRLEAAGYVARLEPDAEDRRRVGLNLTAKGAKALDAVRRRRNDWLAQELAKLPPEAREALAAAIAPLALLAGERP